MSSLNELLASERVGRHWKDKIIYATGRLSLRGETREQNRAKYAESHKAHVCATIADIDKQVEQLDKQINVLQKAKDDFIAGKKDLVQKYNLSGGINKSVTNTNPTEWTAAYPLFSLTVTHEQQYLNNQTKLSTWGDGIKNQVKWLKSFDQKNKNEYGTGVKSVCVTICANGQNVPNDIFTNGWIPKQDKDITQNTYVAYSVEYTDGTSTGWLRWYAYGDAGGAVGRAGGPLPDLDDNADYRALAWAAREQSVKSR